MAEASAEVRPNQRPRADQAAIVAAQAVNAGQVVEQPLVPLPTEEPQQLSLKEQLEVFHYALPRFFRPVGLFRIAPGAICIETIDNNSPNHENNRGAGYPLYFIRCCFHFPAFAFHCVCHLIALYTCLHSLIVVLGLRFFFSV